MRWFALGVAVGALVAALWHGGASATCKAMRAWSAGAIRSLEHRPTAVAAASPPRPAAEPPAPCPANAPDPCRELLAPFDTAEVETVNVDELPPAAPALDPAATTRATTSP
jgi:hypothetical protein